MAITRSCRAGDSRLFRHGTEFAFLPRRTAITNSNTGEAMRVVTIAINTIMEKSASLDDPFLQADVEDDQFHQPPRLHEGADHQNGNKPEIESRVAANFVGWEKATRCLIASWKR